MPHGAPTDAAMSAENVTGLSQRRVNEGLISCDDRIARPSVDMSLADAYMLPPLWYISVNVAVLACGYTYGSASPRLTYQYESFKVPGITPADAGAFS
jgi:hypothetical protein